MAFDRKLRAALRELARADVLAFGPVGFAATVLPATVAYQTVADRLHADGAADLVPHLDRLVAEASPAGKAYAATLLAEVDAAAAERAWRALAADPAEFTTFSGCVMNRTSLAEYAKIHSTFQ
ncbi:MAG TPA: hypothetical protein VFR67_11980 [Pilimelia sp.]|nr:hypothetical protein [Pilimelia sp.]